MKQYGLDGTGSTSGMSLSDVPEPRPARGQVLVRMRAASLNYLDLKIMDGRFGGGARQGLVPLSDGAGEVVETGEDVRRFAVGDRVASTFFPRWIAGPIPPEARDEQPGSNRDGVLREFAVFDEGALVRLPEELSFEEGATLPCAALTAWQVLTGPRPLLPGEVLLTQGSGGVSIFALQFAKLAGARVVVTTSDARKADRLRALGADEIVDYRANPKWGAEVRNLTDGRGADHLIEIGEKGTLEQSVLAAAVNAQINLVGVPDRGGTIDPASIMRVLGTFRRISVGSRQSFEAMLRAMAVHRLRPVIDRVFPFDEAAAAYDYFGRRGHFGKVVIAIG